jgi:putative hydrolase of the HAD superfamily
VNSALLFDLDETLMVEEPAAVASFAATAELAAARSDIDSARLALDARSRARELWYASPTHAYCKRVGISSWEGLWCRFEGESRDVQALRDWFPTYRCEAWRLALADQGLDDPQLAEELGEHFAHERRARHEVFADAREVLGQLRESYSLALVTNGAACLQREKFAASGLSESFEVVVVSADVGAAKPDASIFEHALSRLGATADRAVMIGDSIPKDIDGALAAGLGAIWVNRDGRRPPANLEDPPDGADHTGREDPPDRNDFLEIATLSDLPEALERLD